MVILIIGWVYERYKLKMTQEDYIKRGIEKFKALEDKTQTDLIDYLTLKIVACGFICALFTNTIVS